MQKPENFSNDKTRCGRADKWHCHRLAGQIDAATVVAAQT